MRVVSATVNGAISIVNAIATGKGAALGITKKLMSKWRHQKGMA